ncbi:transporter substrate-binding domain-containing protein [Photobacterium sp. SDRW27]|uniref:transporter substrate-binding domain-containing protein n=1 Tax=Photobacterium obscurum TaxID=2829490 RepID=UPI002242FE58|nr:transporter substrate-binding domain-containing protein [Photobacterium obscurum]MCW8327876.1 transporter substrate-binding domain-containing protein [Photobacterium obscurum]
MSLAMLFKAHWFQYTTAFLLAFGVTFNAYSEVRPERLLLVTQEWRPYQYQEEGDMKGPGIEKLKCTMKVMQQPYQITMTDWDRAQILVEVGEQHGFFLASQNAIRDKYADYSLPVMNQVWSWFSLSDSIDTQSAMFKEEVAVTAIFGSNKWFWLHKSGYRVEKKPRQPTTLIELLLAGEVGAVLANDFVMKDAIQSLGISHRAITRSVVKEKPLGVYFSKKFTKQYPLFVSEFNQAIAQCEER